MKFPYEGVIFDWAWTLLDLGPEDDRPAFFAMAEFLETRGHSLGNPEHAYTASSTLFREQILTSRGCGLEAPYEMILNYMGMERGWDLREADKKEALSVYYKTIYSQRKLYEDTVPVLDAMQKAGLKLGIVSNTTNPPDMKRYELALFRAFRAAGKPVLGVCRGHQVLNVAYGGTLYQDLETQGKATAPHRSVELYDGLAHGLRIQDPSWLFDLYGVEHLEINSVHHQGVKRLGDGLEACAWSEEGIVEAMRDPAEPFVVGVQWHPEWMGPARDDRLDSAPLLEAFLEACARARDAAG